MSLCWSRCPEQSCQQNEFNSPLFCSCQLIQWGSSGPNPLLWTAGSGKTVGILEMLSVTNLSFQCRNADVVSVFVKIDMKCTTWPISELSWKFHLNFWLEFTRVCGSRQAERILGCGDERLWLFPTILTHAGFPSLHFCCGHASQSRWHSMCLHVGSIQQKKVKALIDSSKLTLSTQLELHCTFF